MSLSEQFKTAAENVKNLNQTPTDDELLELYALFKQSEVGDCNTCKLLHSFIFLLWEGQSSNFMVLSTARPGMFDLKGKYKWDAWNGKKGVAKESAQQQYVDKVKELIAKYGLK